MGISVLTWNVEWATPSSARGSRVAAILAGVGADVMVVTEGVRKLLPSDGWIIDAGGDWGYGEEPVRRKVLVWSRFPLASDAVGETGATRGRLAVATAATPYGPVRILGACIPWRDAHVRTGRGDAQPWSEHLDYLDRLEKVLVEIDHDVPTVIAGDFNQRIPRGRQPVRVFDRLMNVFAGWAIHTAGDLPNGRHIDHIATNGQLAAESVCDWADSDNQGHLSDHAGVVCRLRFGGKSAYEPVEDTALAHANGSPPREHVSAPQPHAAHTGSKDIAGAAVPTRGLSTPNLAPELRAEIEGILRRSGDGLSHGATFRLREMGIADAEIAARRGVSVSTTRMFLRSLDALLSGEIPTTKSLALTNSFVYGELLNHARSEALDCFAKAQLRKLKEVNPEVTIGPLHTRTHQYRVGERRRLKPVEEFCPDCAAIGLFHAGRC